MANLSGKPFRNTLSGSNTIAGKVNGITSNTKEETLIIEQPSSKFQSDLEVDGDVSAASLNTGSGDIQTTGAIRGGKVITSEIANDQGSLQFKDGITNTLNLDSMGITFQTFVKPGTNPDNPFENVPLGLSSSRFANVYTSNIDCSGSLLANTTTLGATTVSSLSAGSGNITTTGTLSSGATTVSSLNAGNGAIQTTGALTVGALSTGGTHTIHGQLNLPFTSGGIESAGNVKIVSTGAGDRKLISKVINSDDTTLTIQLKNNDKLVIDQGGFDFKAQNITNAGATSVSSLTAGITTVNDQLYINHDTTSTPADTNPAFVINSRTNITNGKVECMRIVADCNGNLTNNFGPTLSFALKGNNVATAKTIASISAITRDNDNDSGNLLFEVRDGNNNIGSNRRMLLDTQGRLGVGFNNDNGVVGARLDCIDFNSRMQFTNQTGDFATLILTDFNASSTNRVELKYDRVNQNLTITKPVILSGTLSCTSINSSSASSTNSFTLSSTDVRIHTDIYPADNANDALQIGGSSNRFSSAWANTIRTNTINNIAGGGSITCTASLIPGATNIRDLGSSTVGWRNIYLNNAATVISDERMKKEINDSVLGLNFLKLIKPKMYKMSYENSDEKIKLGMISQQIKESLETLGCNYEDFSIINYCDESDIYSLRYEEFISPIIKSIQELNEKVERLEIENAQLKNYIFGSEEPLKFSRME